MQLVVAGVVIGVVVLATALLSSDRMEAFLQRSTGMVNGRFKDTPADRVPDDEGVTPWGRAQQDINSSESQPVAPQQPTGLNSRSKTGCR